jgi:DNA-binding NtrC family response regulator
MYDSSEVACPKALLIRHLSMGEREAKVLSPLVRLQEEKMPSVTIPLTHQGHSEIPTILLVEDEVRVRKVMAQVLQAEGYTVIESGTAEHALVYPDLGFSRLTMLITDVMLPGKTGRQLALDMRNRVPGIKTLLVSGYGESVALMGAERTDGISYLPKPFSATSLLAAVRKALQEVPSPGKKAV